MVYGSIFLCSRLLIYKELINLDFLINSDRGSIIVVPCLQFMGFPYFQYIFTDKVLISNLLPYFTHLRKTLLLLSGNCCSNLLKKFNGYVSRGSVV